MPETRSAAEIQIKLTAIRNARDAGVLIARHGDTSTQFRSLEEMNQIIAILEGELAEAGGAKKKSRVSYIKQSCKGL